MAIKKHSVTTRDIARHLGINQSSVTRALQGRLVGADTIKKVRKAAEELGFRPNAMSKALARGRTGMYGVLVSDVHNPHYARIVEALQDAALLKNHFIFLSLYENDFDRYLEGLDLMILDRRVDGVFVIPTLDERLEPALEKYAKEGVPLMFYGGNTRPLSQNSHSIYSDYYSAGRDIAAHLFALGHRRVGVVLGIYPDPQKTSGVVTEARVVGVLQYYRERGCPIDESAYVIPCGTTPEDAYRVSTQLLALEKRPTAIIALNDVLALGVFKAIREQHLRVPEDISFTGFDNTNLSEFMDITSVDSGETERAREAVEIMDGLINQKENKERGVITRVHAMQLIPRGSTGPAPTKET